MKNFTFFVFLFIYQYAHSQGIGIGSTNPPHSSAALDVNSTTKGLLIPRMTTAERNAIVSPLKGLQVFDNTTNSFWYFNGTAWTNVYVGNFSLPFNSTGSVTSPTDLFSITNTSSGDAIYGQSNGGGGVFGKSTSGAGVRGVSSSNIGVYGLSSSHAGVYGYGVYGGYFESYSNTYPALVAANSGSGGAAIFYGNVKMDNNLAVVGISNLNGNVTMGNNATVNGTLTVNNANVNGILTVNSAIVDGSLKVNNNKGVAYNNSSSINLKIYPFTTTSLFAVLPAHGSATTLIGLPGGFTSAPRVFVGDIDYTVGTAGELNRVILVVQGCNTVGCNVKIINTDTSPVNYEIRWNMLAIGY